MLGDEHNRKLCVVMLCALLLFLSGAWTFSLPSVDHCLFARWGVEMNRSNNFFSATWNNIPEFQYPPLFFACLAVSFRLFGESDAAARLPTIFFSIGSMCLIYLIGRRFFSREASLTAIALLLVTPFYLYNSRGVTTECALLFWICLTTYFFLKGLSAKQWHFWLCLPLAAGILTKSVLGLLPLWFMAIFWLLDDETRKNTNLRILFAGIAVGLVLASSWWIYSCAVYGARCIDKHLGDIMARVRMEPLTFIGYWKKYLFDHTFWGSFLPISVLGAAGAVLSAYKSFGNREYRALIPSAWWLGTLGIYSFLGETADRYIFPVVLPLSLLGGYLIQETSPKIAALINQKFIPAFCLCLAVVFLFFPSAIESAARIDQLRLPVNDNRIFIDSPSGIDRELMGQKRLPFIGPARGVGYHSPRESFLYYREVLVAPMKLEINNAVQKVGSLSPAGALCSWETLGRIKQAGIGYEKVAQGKHWAWVRFAHVPEDYGSTR